ncbi:MAG: dihydropteroate synthase [Holophagaceae bacterium]|nr:dihydropteroate synthase [Holophagaceae bacterium]
MMAFGHPAIGPLPKSGPFFIGILNLTPDSFSDGGRFLAPDAALAQARKLAADGAGMIDLGAESTRPGAAEVAPANEWARLDPVVATLREQLPGLPLSLDTRHAEVAERGLEGGISVLNDVTGFSNPPMLELAKGSACGLIAMRSRMKDNAFWMPDYGDPGPRSAEPALSELKGMLERLLKAGIQPEKIVLDPGFGFGTTYPEDSSLWGLLPRLPSLLAWPQERFCIGISRKRFLAWRNGTPELPPMERDQLTAAAHQEAMAMGYRVFRTHEIP